jgi:hypothetical protein
MLFLSFSLLALTLYLGLAPGLPFLSGRHPEPNTESQVVAHLYNTLKHLGLSAVCLRTFAL